MLSSSRSALNPYPTMGDSLIKSKLVDQVLVRPERDKNGVRSLAAGGGVRSIDGVVPEGTSDAFTDANSDTSTSLFAAGFVLARPGLYAAGFVPARPVPSAVGFVPGRAELASDDDLPGRLRLPCMGVSV